MAILVQNVGDSTLNAKLSADDTNQDLEILKHKNKKVKIIAFYQCSQDNNWSFSMLDDNKVLKDARR